MKPPDRLVFAGRACFSALRVGLLGLAGCGGPTQAELGAGAAERELPKHVILISIDTLRADHVGCYGYERDTTPNLDRLAEESMLFERAYTTMSWTLIAHMSMLTGLYPSQHKVWKNDAVLSTEVPTLAQRLQAQGYHTIGFYDTQAHWVDPEFGYDRGFALYEGHTNAELAGEHLRKALAERPKEQPLFVFLHLFDVHNAPLRKWGTTIYNPPAPFDTHFVPDARERLVGANCKKWWYTDASDATAGQREAIAGLYDSGVRYIDDRIGRWLEEWKAAGFYDQSLIIVTSDHGEGLCERADHYTGHGDANEEGLRVPFLMKLPSARFAGTRSADPVSHVDILPTVVDLLGLPQDARLPGYSLLAGRPADSIVFAERDETQVVIRGPYKLIQHPTRKEIGTLFDLAQDPMERGPIRQRSADAALREQFETLALPLRAAAEKAREGWFQPKESELRVQPIDASMKKQLEEMGYASGGEDDEDERGEADPDADGVSEGDER